MPAGIVSAKIPFMPVFRSASGFLWILLSVLAIAPETAHTQTDIENPGLSPSPAPPSPLEQEFIDSSNLHMKMELGVNDITTPSIATILGDLDEFRPIPIDTINANDRHASYSNRMQTALHFGSLVADGFLLTVAERSGDIEEVGKALIRHARALGVGDRLTARSQSLLDLSSQSDWIGMRRELVRTQGDVEASMLELRDEEMAHMVSLGGWLRGFQLAAESTAANYSTKRAGILARGEILDYYLDRLDTLHPRLRKTEYVTFLIEKLRGVRRVIVETQGEPPTEQQVQAMSELANEAMAVALGAVDPSGNLP